jgi:uncharacterized protein YjbI with pentapeptide repeats
MDKAETLALFAQGRTVWNPWAVAMIDRHSTLVAAGKWQFTVEPRYPGDVIPQNDETRAWMSESIALFAQHDFIEVPDFSGFVFPGVALFMSAGFLRGARFAGARFHHGACFNGARFEGPADFADVEFASEGTFMIATFASEARFSGCRFCPGVVQPNMEGHSWFESARFAGPALFDRVRFMGSSLFDEAHFAAEADFTDAEFCRYFSFTRTRFDGLARFGGAALSEEPIFSESDFAQPPER